MGRAPDCGPPKGCSKVIRRLHRCRRLLAISAIAKGLVIGIAHKPVVSDLGSQRQVMGSLLALAPGLMMSAMTERWLNDPATHAALMKNSPIGRAGQLVEMSGMALFLARLRPVSSPARCTWWMVARRPTEVRQSLLFC